MLMLFQRIECFCCWD